MDLDPTLVYLAVVLLLGTLSSGLAYHLRTSNVFFLILVGMIFSVLGFLSFPQETIITIALIALILVIFGSTNKFSFREFLKKSIISGKLTMLFMVLNLIALSIGARFLAGLDWLPAILLASIVYGIDEMIAVSMFKGKQHEIIDILEVESIINTPLTIIIPVLIMGLLSNAQISAGEAIVPFVQQIILGIGIGLITGLFVVLILKHAFMGDLSHLVLLTSAIITYVSSEAINGNGVLAIATFGLVFGNTKVHHKVELEQFTSIFSYTLEILVFIMMGTFLIIKPEYILIGSVLFLLHILVRFLSVQISLRRLPFKHKLFMSLNVPKGIDVAVIVLLLISQYSGVNGIDAVINISLLFILYSVVLSTMVSLFSVGMFQDKEDISKTKPKKTVIQKKRYQAAKG